ncbi:4-hydroxy-3-methylbut-2-enyl diphosphate reductase [Teichococcus vastitatis]|uniref:4-hydroxy-3-methylbut-2-enyl diphosphate reductase n=1 Tax=Teichococcus vastitatis TaxID=2307076 RepID=A0ABS9VZW5_9PROT|nr:4-hydroxy-3-methylbut-2-enyl diphosphate reductase [Pseudoroseomonas vastitatis]MCI0752583.1 4-hydroxy-3-methylbut-2-enyl diphosphate reductase [Pseudoroseomonas vastitatis]
MNHTAPLGHAVPSVKPALHVLMAGPRGFCAGVDRAIKIVEEAIRKFGAPVYVRHEIVHNKFVVDSLKAQGAVFVEELDEVPEDAPVVFSAHGVPKAVPAEAKRRQMIYLDATCPLVSKVHREAEHQSAAGRHILLIGHAGHPEVVGTLGQLPPGSFTLVETEEDAERITVPEGPLSYTTQTTLSVEDTAGIVAALRRRFPQLTEPHKDSICYATTNRQGAVRAIAERAEMVVVVGAPNSSNSVRLREVAERAGCPIALMVQRGAELDPSLADGMAMIGITAGASAPELLVQEVLDRLRERFTLTLEEVVVAEENITFKLPALLNR